MKIVIITKSIFKLLILLLLAFMAYLVIMGLTFMGENEANDEVVILVFAYLQFIIIIPIIIYYLIKNIVMIFLKKSFVMFILTMICFIFAIAYMFLIVVPLDNYVMDLIPDNNHAFYFFPESVNMIISVVLLVYVGITDLMVMLLFGASYIKLVTDDFKDKDL